MIGSTSSNENPSRICSLSYPLWKKILELGSIPPGQSWSRSSSIVAESCWTAGVHCKCQRNAIALAQERSFRSDFSSVQMAFADFFPRSRGSWHETSQYSSCSNRCRIFRHTLPGTRSRPFEKLPAPAIFESSDDRLEMRCTPGAYHSMGCRFEEHKKCRRQFFWYQRMVVLPLGRGI